MPRRELEPEESVQYYCGLRGCIWGDHSTKIDAAISQKALLRRSFSPALVLAAVVCTAVPVAVDTLLELWEPKVEPSLDVAERAIEDVLADLAPALDVADAVPEDDAEELAVASAPSREDRLEAASGYMSPFRVMERLHGFTTSALIITCQRLSSSSMTR